jgi:serine/threonine protein kinase
MVQFQRGLSAAADLVGVTLPGGVWRVVSKVTKKPGDTGGNFSVNYWVEEAAGRRAFCKVLDFEKLVTINRQQNMDPITALAEAVRVYEFERDMARQCKSLSKVITAIDDGAFEINGYAYPLVAYIIFESADGDIRRLLNHADAMDLAVRLRCVHNVSVGLQQLHSIGIAHQDVKPSNALVFTVQDGLRDTKLGDLGRASSQNRQVSHDAYAVAGDPRYPPCQAQVRHPEGAGDTLRA